MIDGNSANYSPLFALLLIISTGCERAPELTNAQKKRTAIVPDASKDDLQVQVKIGRGKADDWGHLPFEILKVYRDQRPTDAPPWHAGEGDWTFFDCLTTTPSSAHFTIGVHTKTVDGHPFEWGEATLNLTDRNEGTRLLDCLSAAFKQKPPPDRTRQPLEAWKFATTVLGEGMKRSPEGGFSGHGGGWSATKWFLQRDGFEAEVFFNYDLTEMKGEFSEKDPDYREDLLSVMAIVLRDGPRPERTPATDPNLTDIGPKFGNGRLIATNVQDFRFSPSGERIVFSEGSQGGSTSVYCLAPSDPNPAIEVAHVENHIYQFNVLDGDANRLLIVEVVPKEKGRWTSENSKRLWWIDRTKNEMRQLTGPWDDKSLSLADKPVSPDGRFVIIESWRPRTDVNRGGYSVIHVLDRQSETTHTIDLVNQTPDPVGWSGSGKELRLVFLKNRRWDKDQKQEWFVCEPETGRYVPTETSPLPSNDLGDRLSPDGTQVADVFGKERLTVTNLKTGSKQEFTFNEDDRHMVNDEVYQWVNPRYLLLHLDRLAFLDVRTMKMSYPLNKADKSNSHTFSPDFKWVLSQRPEDGVYVSSIIIPPDAP